jgi:hypothetical protein
MSGFMARQMTCSWCDEKIPFFQRLRRSRYCSIEHRDEEFEHLKKLAIKRLLNVSAFKYTENEKAAVEAVP